MASVTISANQMLGILLRRLPTVGPVLLLSMGYIDPGKWAAAIDGGARFGFDLSVLMLIFNFAAILCQYLAARIGVVTGKNLAQIYSEEYNKSTCILLGVQAELSVISSDLTMILGTAHGLNLLFGMDLLTCVFFAATDAVLFPLFTNLWKRSHVVSMSIMAFLLLSYVLGVAISQPDISVAMNGVPTRLSGESVFSLMSLLGATIVPHNFYVHSSIVQQLQVQPHVSKDTMCHDHFVAIICMFSGIFVVNYVLMNSAATVFHSAGLPVPTFQDALLLMDQVFRSPIAPLVFFLVLFISSQIAALTWNFSGQVVLRYLFMIDLPDWLHRAIIRILAIVPALCCAWNYGAEGIYQMLIFTQVMLAMLLPSSIIPLYRVASSRLIMGVFKVPQFVEFLTVITLIGMLGLKIIFVVEMLFGNSDWVGNMRSNMGSSAVLPYVLVTGCLSLCMMLWLAATPLKSATVKLDSQLWYSDVLKTQLQPSVGREENNLIEGRNQEEPAEDDPALGKSLGCPSDGSVVEYDIDLPETIMDSDQEPLLISAESHAAITSTTTAIAPSTNTAVLGSITSHPEESASTTESVPDAVVGIEACDDKLQDSGSTSLKCESVDPVEKTAGVGGDVQTEKDDDEGDTWEPEEPSKVVSGSGPSSTSEGPGSLRSLSGKGDEGGNGVASLSRLSGLGRAARRQLAAILDEFWGQLYDFHGQATQEAKTKKLDMLLGADPRPTASSPKLDPSGNESSGYFFDRGSGFLVNTSLYDSPKQQRVPKSVASSYGAQMGSSSSWSSHRQIYDAYVNSSRNNIDDYGERRYSSLRLPPSSEGWDYQPATVHGYQIASYLSRMASERDSDPLTSLMDPPTPKSTSFVPTNYRDSIAYSLGQKPQNGISSTNASAIRNPAVGRNISLQTERPYFDPCSVGMENVETSAYNKKYHSLPDISGLVIPGRESFSSERSAQWGGPIGFGQLAGRTNYEQSSFSNSGLRAEGVPLAFDEISPSKLYRDPFSVQRSSNLDTRSLWSRQPFEQLFGVAGRTQRVGDEGFGSRSNSVLPEASSHIDLEAKLLQSFRYCIVKLLKLEGSDWLFRQNDGADEDLIHLVAAREKFHYEAETREVNRAVQMGDSRYLSSDRKFNSALRNEEAGLARLLVSSVPHCGEGCVWRVDLIVSFGVWCIHRILILSLMESRPELWGKYTFVLNRLQGILDLAFSKPRSPLPPCFCLEVPVLNSRRSSPPQSNGLLSPSGKPVKVKCTSATTLLDVIKEVENAVSCRKGRTGTAAGDVAFPKGKENLASVLKRYKRRLSNKPVGTHEGGPGSRKVPIPTSYSL
ncbi:LOW QUALITY PROTEIN: ethylene-insensitive protein 2-like [Macadamia integrifolia]|uniref:LOW QUALITY PROTEIN: ethylene-insensitive protein 2-like n=1 Tax=Macadamia integrifolia TaxID=60698 RepID=UPI001C4E843D|nr:LOW QUALITY PROTEIN: ethylene-insensitive protein 2-like [Macadamia integrifolia]